MGIANGFRQREGLGRDLVEDAARLAGLVVGLSLRREQIAAQPPIVGGHDLLDGERVPEQPGRLFGRIDRRRGGSSAPAVRERLAQLAGVEGPGEG